MELEVKSSDSCALTLQAAQGMLSRICGGGPPEGWQGAKLQKSGLSARGTRTTHDEPEPCVFSAQATSSRS